MRARGDRPEGRPGRDPKGRKSCLDRKIEFVRPLRHPRRSGDSGCGDVDRALEYGWVEPSLNTSEDGSITDLFVFKGYPSNDIQAVRRHPCPDATVREQCTTGGLYSSGVCEISARTPLARWPRLNEKTRRGRVPREQAAIPVVHFSFGSCLL